MTQAALAEAIGIEKSLVSDYERGKIRVYDELLIRFAIALDVSADLLLGIDGKGPGVPPVSLRLSKRLLKIERLPLAQQKALLKNIDMYLKAAESE
jgi:transcriptional regulator with XRE-family HTH domain